MVSTWPVYVDKALLPVLEAKAGLTLNYIEDYNDNNEYFAKVQPQLSCCFRRREPSWKQT